MIKKHVSDVKSEQVAINGAQGATIQWLITDQDGAQRYVMRRFEIKPNGIIPLHAHPEEHEIYVLSGQATILSETDETISAQTGDILYVAPFEKHGYKNEDHHPFSFLCVIPLLPK
jgi:quercetin dioxygenase-like cupin family protein